MAEECLQLNRVQREQLLLLGTVSGQWPEVAATRLALKHLGIGAVWSFFATPCGSWLKR